MSATSSMDGSTISLTSPVSISETVSDVSVLKPKEASAESEAVSQAARETVKIINPTITSRPDNFVLFIFNMFTSMFVYIGAEARFYYQASVDIVSEYDATITSSCEEHVKGE
jgi:hypothetical protein